VLACLPQVPHYFCVGLAQTDSGDNFQDTQSGGNRNTAEGNKLVQGTRDMCPRPPAVGLASIAAHS
jgi:hypothetical protein